MCEDNKPCNEAGKDEFPNTQALFSRLESLIVMTELHATHNVDAPHAAVAMIDVLGPLLMDNIRKAMKWDGLQMAQAIIKQKNAMFEGAGMPVPVNPMEKLVDMLAEMMDEAKKNGTKAEPAA